MKKKSKLLFVIFLLFTANINNTQIINPEIAVQDVTVNAGQSADDEFFYSYKVIKKYTNG